jgi:hypothetical protein
MPLPVTTTFSSCARAATAAETRYRIDAPIVSSRGARVVALDAGAAAVAARVATQPWGNARFFSCEALGQDKLAIRGIGNAPADLDDQLADADVVVMIATEDSGAAAAYAIGKACWERSIMTAGVVVAVGDEGRQAVAALRPHARVLLPSADESDVTELLTALRA